MRYLCPRFLTCPIPIEGWGACYHKQVHEESTDGDCRHVYKQFVGCLTGECIELEEECETMPVVLDMSK